MKKNKLFSILVAIIVTTTFFGFITSADTELNINDNNSSITLSKPDINGPTSGKVGDTFEFSAVSEISGDLDEDPLIIYVWYLFKPKANPLNGEILEIKVYPPNPDYIIENEDKLFEDLEYNEDIFTYCNPGETASASFTVDKIGNYIIGCFVYLKPYGCCIQNYTELDLNVKLTNRPKTLPSIFSNFALFSRLLNCPLFQRLQFV